MQTKEYGSAKNLLDNAINTTTKIETLLKAHYLRGIIFFHEARWFHALNDFKHSYNLHQQKKGNGGKFELEILKMICLSTLNIVEEFNKKNKSMGGDSFLEREEEWILKLLDTGVMDEDIENLLDRYVVEKISSTPLILKYRDDADRYKKFVNILEKFSQKYSGYFQDLLIDLIMTLKYEDKDYKTARKYAIELIKLKPKKKILRDAVNIVKIIDSTDSKEPRL